MTFASNGARSRVRQHDEDRYAAARAWKARGGRVIAYLCDNVPVELMEAAGFLPVRVTADPTLGTERFDRMIAGQGRVSDFAYSVALYEFILSGGLDFADLLLLPHNRKAMEEMHWRLAGARQADPGLAIPDTLILDRSYLVSFESSRFNRQQVRHFRHWLEDRRGAVIEDAALVDACAAAERHRALLGKAMALRKQSRLSGQDALALLVTAQTLPRAEHVALVEAVLDEPVEPITGPRIFLAGSPFDHPALYRAVEEAGGIIVGEDHCFGMRCVERILAPDLAPMAAIEERYHRQAGCSIASPIQRNVDACLMRARACGASAAVFAVMRGDGTHLWTTPDEKAALEAAGLACLHLGDLDHVPSPAQLDRLSDFVKALV